MRKRIVGVALTATIVAVVLFAAPLAFAVRQLYFSEAQGALERAALRAVSVVGPQMQGDDPIQLPGSEAGMDVGLYSAAGLRVAGTGPATADVPVLHAEAGQAGQAQAGGSLVWVVPVTANENVVGVVRASTPAAQVWRRVAISWGALIGLALLAVALAVLVARRQARRLSGPLESLARSARVLGDGDFSVRTTPSGVPEIDETGSALDLTAARLGQLLAREREFSANASHQLRTPLTGLRLRLESALDQSDDERQVALHQAIASADDLEQTIADLISLTRGLDAAQGPVVTADQLLADVDPGWQSRFAAQGRSLTLRAEPDAPVTAWSPIAVKQVLEVLLDNAARHGAGAVDVLARDSGGVLAIDVRDDGAVPALGGEVFVRGHSGGSGTGIGLAFARDLAQSRGGRLILSQSVPCTVFTLLVPAAPEPTAFSQARPAT